MNLADGAVTEMGDAPHRQEERPHVTAPVVDHLDDGLRHRLLDGQRRLQTRGRHVDVYGTKRRDARLYLGPCVGIVDMGDNGTSVLRTRGDVRA